jgi:hypothetical protein
MDEQIKIKKTIYGLEGVESYIDTKFSQLVNAPKAESPVTMDQTIDEFFEQYDSLFYEIPISGSDNSHLDLATRSLDYIGLSLDDLQNEIEILRTENVSLKNQLLLTTQITTGSLAI